MSDKHLILWDGDCEFCRRAVAWALLAEQQRVFTASPYQEAPSPPMTPELHTACAHAVHVATPEGKMLKAGRAVLFILAHTAWRPLALFFALPPFIWGVELFYWIVARNRPFFARFLFTQEPKS